MLILKNITLVNSIGKIFCGLPFVFFSGSTSAANFGNDISGYAWADTPQGKFECHNNQGTENLQLLKIDGRTIFKENLSPNGIRENNTLAAGIAQQGVGCPWIVANERGRIVVLRDTQPPAYGIQGYAVIDFNEKVPVLTPLADAQRPNDDKISDGKRFVWTEKGLKFHYFGYLPGEPAGQRNSPRPRAHELFLNYSSHKTEVVK